jgi:hypothetical protein
MAITSSAQPERPACTSPGRRRSSPSRLARCPPATASREGSGVSEGTSCPVQPAGRTTRLATGDESIDDTRLELAHHLASTHDGDYAAVFGALPDLGDAARFPAAGKPGDPAYDAMAAGDRRAVTQVYVNVGKALEAFERTPRPPPTRLDDYLGGDLEALAPSERSGSRDTLLDRFEAVSARGASALCCRMGAMDAPFMASLRGRC